MPRPPSPPRTAASTRPAPSSTSSCSQRRSTVHPAASSRRVVSASRARLARTFSAQKLAFVLATVWCSGQPCQKQPSTNTATRARGNTRSAVRRSSGIGRRETKYRRPRRCSSRRNASSGFVSRPLFACIPRRTPGLDAQESLASLMRSTMTARLPITRSTHPRMTA